MRRVSRSVLRLTVVGVAIAAAVLYRRRLASERIIPERAHQPVHMSVGDSAPAEPRPGEYDAALQ
jgi:hypothetical protein